MKKQEFFQLITSHFSFLESQGFTRLDEDDNFGYYASFSNGSIKLSLSYDMREFYVSLGINCLLDPSPWWTYQDIAATEIGTSEKRETLRQAEKDMQSLSKQFWRRIPAGFFDKYINLFATFVREHLPEILAWQPEPN
jgi:hypothetical protein